MPVPPRVATRTNWWAWAALAAGCMTVGLFPILWIGIIDQRVAEQPIVLRDGLAVTALGLPGVVLSVIGILVGLYRRGFVEVWIAILGGIAALVMTSITLWFMLG
jgi:hypothetical protein